MTAYVALKDLPLDKVVPARRPISDSPYSGS